MTSTGGSVNGIAGSASFTANGGTTTLTVAVMYFLGGEGIHGFTFVLLIGILVGTYSSVAIAAPLLLWGKDVKRPTGVMQAPVGQIPRASV